MLPLFLINIYSTERNADQVRLSYSPCHNSLGCHGDGGAVCRRMGLASDVDDGGVHCRCRHVHAECQRSGLGNKRRHCEGGGGGTSWGSTWPDSGLRGSICLFDKKSSVRKENKQPGVLLPWSQRKSSYSSITQYLQCRSDAHSHTHSGAHVPARVWGGGTTEVCVQKAVVGVKVIFHVQSTLL